MSEKINDIREDGVTPSQERSVSGKQWDYVNQPEVDEEEVASEAEPQSDEGQSHVDPLVELEQTVQKSAGEKLAAVEAELAKSLEENARYLDQMARVQAEAKNIQNAAKKDVESARKFALKNIVQELLTVVDNFERSMSAAHAEQTEGSGLLEGVTLTHKSLLACLEKFGVEPLNPLGEAFNPEFHEAISMQPSDKLPPNSVLEVLQKGYLLNGRLMRPAMVVVVKN